MNRDTVFSCSVICLLASAFPSWAHRPTISDGTAVDADSALDVEDVSISQVVYHEVAEGAAGRLWLTFEAAEGQELYMQLGLPLLDRLVDYRPSLALLGPGLVGEKPPFEIPEGLGAIVLKSDGVSDPEVFYEPFTGTSSWILFEEEIAAPASGRYYLVAFEPDGTAGKLWAAVGRREVFGLEDIVGLPPIVEQVRQFHEVEEGATGPCFLLPFGFALVAIGFHRLARPR